MYLDPYLDPWIMFTVVNTNQRRGILDIVIISFPRIFDDTGIVSSEYRGLMI